MRASRYDPDAFYPLGHPAGRQRRRARPCAHPGCSRPGEYRAPKDRSLAEYQWLCLEHVREFNRNWNYYKDMPLEWMEAEREAETARARRAAFAAHEARLRERVNQARRRHKAFFGFFQDDDSAGRERKKKRQDIPPSFLHRPAILAAMAVLGMSWPLTPEQLKARYKLLVKRHHPDVNRGARDAEERLKEVNEAYRVVVGALQAVGAPSS